ncbi:MAG: c-type cytochrome [Gemmatimonadota bacterium]|nr:c-type cytochrome [Gemmatimonadota bacterium]
MMRASRRLRYLAWLALMGAGACVRSDDVSLDRHVEGGDVTRGRVQIVSYGCGSCHTIPGVTGAIGMVGPPLTSWSQRRIIAGEVPNTPANLITWITVPQSIEPGVAMPNLGVSDGQARDIAAYLYSLK